MPYYYNWTGFYIGAHVGAAWTNKDWRDVLSGIEIGHTASGFIGGVQGGYNWQAGSWVIGIEAQASWADINKAVDWVDPNTPPVGLVRRTDTTVENLGTVALRVGQAWDRSLVYAKGGVAWVHETYRLFNATGTAVPLISSLTDTRWGWMLGIGYEYAFLGNWSAKVEFDYLGFGTERITLTGLGTRSFDVEHDIALVKLGINYRFGGPPYTRY